LTNNCEQSIFNVDTFRRFELKARIQKWGNSLALRIPKSFASEAGLQRETSIEISLSEGKIIITPLVQSKLTLRQLLAKVNEENLHHEIDTGPAAGNEAW
jgi:antitoxin MazE